MNNDDIVFLSNDNQIANNNPVIQPIELNNDQPKVQINHTDNDIITLPDWDLTPPFDSLDRGGMQ